MQKKMQKKISKFIAALLLVVMFMSTIFINSVETFAYGDSKQGVVVVIWYLKDVDVVAVQNNKVIGVVESKGDMPYSRGTGFFVGDTDENPTHVVTNFHCIDDFVNTSEGDASFINLKQKTSQGYDLYYRYQSSEIRVYYSETEFDVAYVVDYGDLDKVDLAILKLKKPTDKRKALELLVPTQEMVGQEVYAVGFPALSDNVVTDASKWGIDDMTITKGVINRLVAASGTGVESIQSDAQISGGNSGGPMVDKDGNVVGINTWTVGSEDKFTYAINVSELITMLERNKITYEMANTETDDEEDDNTTIIVIVAVSVVVVIAIIVILVSLSKNKKKNNAGAVKVSGAQNQANSLNVVNQAVKRTPMLRSLASQHKGACFAVGNTTLFVGRDASVCKITFKDGSVGVSGKHCSIMYNAQTNEFVLTDLGSTYGTFLANGQKLQPNIAYRLKSGETFYVGDKANTLLVEVK